MDIAASAAPQRHLRLDWRAAQARLGPVRRKWDLAILCNLDEVAGLRPADLVSAINAQAGPGQQLSGPVLSGRLRVLEQGGYIRHADLSVMPLIRVYYLQPLGAALVSDVESIVGPPCQASGPAWAPGTAPVGGR